MNNIINTNSTINDQELDYLYALYKSSQSGSGVELTKEELKKLIESDRLSQQADMNCINENIRYKKRGVMLNVDPMPNIKDIPNADSLIAEMINDLTY